ncbi:patatin-like phospholipase family protein [Alicyclobacillus sp.]|uniref:patatin-like phospholipase family protein n=1 Tax=Alicyclobacillus sp. TaxID=61169 RepID=UPI0025B90674|nr:patatin-like phospholipase family protein [Alicyclobacillus sp.]MCL6516038.1 patatin-like phospholipase family protein [Alicyclobacillus sp.]
MNPPRLTARVKTGPRRVGLALCGGELLVTVHVGVLEALHRMGVVPDMVAGTSAGAVMAALYAHGYGPGACRDLIRRFPGMRLFDYAFPATRALWRATAGRWCADEDWVAPGLFAGRRLQRYLARLLRGRAACLPYAVVATDLVSGTPVVFSTWIDLCRRGVATHPGDLSRALLASCAIPGVVTPVRMGNWVLVDGGLRDLVPVRVLREAGCTHILAVNLHRLHRPWRPDSVFQVLRRSIDVMLQESVEADTAGSDVLALKPAYGPVHWWSRRGLVTNADMARESVWQQRHSIRAFLARAGDDSNGPSCP